DRGRPEIALGALDGTARHLRSKGGAGSRQPRQGRRHALGGRRHGGAHQPRRGHLPQPDGGAGGQGVARAAGARLRGLPPAVPPAGAALQRGADPARGPAAQVDPLAGFGLPAGAVHL
ncbi:MAG: hypothetical protein AVDCRST_MAG08-1520, partial [uncultured Acetobacteraceae bacterium]